MTRHPDAGVLAEYREGLLGRRHSARIRAHLDGCPRCASLDADLAGVSTLLASSPPPGMPSHLIARLDGALAAEAASRPQPVTAAGDAAVEAAGAGANGATAGVPAGGSTPERDQPGPSRGGSNHGWWPGRRPARPAGQARRRPAVLGAAAAAVIVLAGVGYGLASLGQQPGGASASSGTAAGSSGASSGAAGTGTGSSGTAAGPAAGTGHSAAVNGPAVSPAKVAPGTQLRVIHSGTDYQPGTLGRQAEKTLASHFGSNSSSVPVGASEQARSCVMLVTGGMAAQLVDTARYRGQPATIIVRAPSAGKPGQVWVTGPACSAQHHDILAHTSLPSSG